jgi:hypothetical protein
MSVVTSIPHDVIIGLLYRAGDIRYSTKLLTLVLGEEAGKHPPMSTFGQFTRHRAYGDCITISEFVSSACVGGAIIRTPTRTNPLQSAPCTLGRWGRNIYMMLPEDERKIIDQLAKRLRIESGAPTGLRRAIHYLAQLRQAIASKTPTA